MGTQDQGGIDANRQTTGQQSQSGPQPQRKNDPQQGGSQTPKTDQQQGGSTQKPGQQSQGGERNKDDSRMNQTNK